MSDVQRKRDPRWQDVVACKYKPILSEEELQTYTGRLLSQFTTFEIVVMLDGEPFWCRQKIHDENMADVALQNVEKWLFEEMAQQVDRYMEEAGK